jgi:hypothetical protein
LATQITFHAKLALDYFPDAVYLTFGQVTNFRVPADLRFGHNLPAARQPDAEDIGERYFRPFVSGEINSRNSRQALTSSLRQDLSKLQTPGLLTPASVCALDSRR